MDLLYIYDLYIAKFTLYMAHYIAQFHILYSYTYTLYID